MQTLPTHAWNTELGNLENLGSFLNAREAVYGGRYLWFSPDEPFDAATSPTEDVQRWLLARGLAITVDQDEDWLRATARKLLETKPGDSEADINIGEEQLLDRKTPFGFKRADTGALEEDPREQLVIKRIPAMAKHASPREIASKLRGEGFRITTACVRKITEGVAA